jgi:hypothetical protein
MPSITLSIQYQKNRNIALSPSELKALYFFGIPINDPADPKTLIPDETFDFYIEAAQREIENFLTIKIGRQAYKEKRDFVHDDWMKWGYVPLTYPAVKALNCRGFMNTTMQVDYPEHWLSTKEQTGEEFFYRQMHLVPVSGAANVLTGNSIYVGIAPYIGYFGSAQIPNYWEMTYITGFHKVPLDIVHAIGKLAAIGILNILGDIPPIGAGIASKSISIDGLSQSVSSTQSATNAAYGARIGEYKKDLDKALPLLKSKYLGIVFGAC